MSRANADRWWEALRLVSAIGVGGVSVLLGLGFVFSDLGPGESLVTRLLTGASFYLISSLVLGLLNPRFWYLGLLPAIGPVALAIFGVIVSRGRLGTLPSGNYLVLVGLAPVCATLIGAKLGQSVGVSWSRRTH